MRDKKVIGFGMAAVVLAVAVIVAIRVNKAGPEVAVPEQPAAKPFKAVAQVPSAGQKPAPTRVLPHQQQSGDRTARRRAGQNATVSGAVAPASQTGQAEEMTEARLKAVEAWEGFVDVVAERTGNPTADQALAFKREFAKLDKVDQMDGIQTALNLLPEEQFPVLYPILFDKTIDPDILDEIFSDGLNHEEDIKVPMMKEIYKDKEHPMYVEAARILDATGELDEESGAAEDE
jgi:hypothetical protein